MSWALAGAFAAAFCYGVATVLQAVAVGRTERSDALDPGLLLRLARSAPYVGGLALDTVGFLLSLAALRRLPLFVVQAIAASSLAFTAVLATAFLHARLRRREWVGVLVVVAGLAMLASSANEMRPAGTSLSDRLLLLAAVGGLAVLSVGVANGTRRGSGVDSWVLGAFAGLGYGATSIGARMLVHPGTPVGLLSDPATYALAGAGLLALLLYAQALQRGAVTGVTAAVVAAETLTPAAVGLLLLSDHPRHGFGAVEVAGFALTVLGSLSLARQGEVVVHEAGHHVGAAEQPADALR